MRKALAGLGVGLALLVGCSDSSRPASGAAAQTYFPMVEGARWLYELRAAPVGTIKVEVEARGPMPLPKQGGVVFVLDEKTLGPDLGFVQVAPVAYLESGGYIARLTAIDYDAEGNLRVLGEEGPTWILPADPTPGRRWSQQTELFRTPEGGGGELGWTGEVMPRAVLDVPAGHFEDVLEVLVTYRDASEAGVAPKVVYHDFYARGVGLVRSITEDPSGDPSHRIEQVLLEYHFPR